MKKYIIVEGKGDKFFFEGLLEHLNIPPVIIIKSLEDDLGTEPATPKSRGLSKDMLIKALKSCVETCSNGNNEIMIGILIDADYVGKGEGEMEGGVEKRIALINSVIEIVTQINPKFSTLCSDITHFSTLEVELPTFEKISIKVGCHLTNIEDCGNLDTLQMAIADKPNAHIANCLTAWKDCYEKKLASGVIQKGYEIKKLEGEYEKLWVWFCQNYDKSIEVIRDEFEKQWVDFYKKYDNLKHNDRGDSVINTSLETIMLGRKNTKGVFVPPTREKLFNLDSPQPDFQKLCSFLKCFS